MWVLPAPAHTIKTKREINKYHKKYVDEYIYVYMGINTFYIHLSKHTSICAYASHMCINASILDGYTYSIFLHTTHTHKHWFIGGTYCHTKASPDSGANIHLCLIDVVKKIFGLLTLIVGL